MEEMAHIRAAQNGDTESFRMIFEENRQKVFGLAFNYVRNTEDAEDILQDTFIKAFRSLSNFQLERGTGFSSWLTRIAVNCSLDHLRKKKTQTEILRQKEAHSDAVMGLSNPNADHEQSAREIREKIDQVLTMFPPRQRMIFILKHYQQFTIKEISEYLETSEGNVKKQLFRAISSLKKQMRKFFPEGSHGMQKI